MDVAQNRDRYKDSFDIPTEEELQRLETNDRVKISNGLERFFVQVQQVDGDTVTGRVMNHLVGNHAYGYQDMVAFEKRHIFVLQKRPPPDPAAARQRRMMRMLGVESHALQAILHQSRSG